MAKDLNCFALHDLAGVLMFAKVVEARSFTATAELLGVSQAQVSKEISRLEKALGARLLNRTTRRLSLTEVGGAFYEHCKRIVEELEGAKASVASHYAEPVGLLRVTTPVAFGINHIAPGISDLVERYPKLQVDLMLNDRLVNLAEEGFDIAVRIVKQPQATLVARQLAPIRWAVCAAPAYFARHGRPSRVAELAEHNCLLYPQISSNNQWEFRRDGQSFAVTIAGNFVANSGEALREAAIGGLGIVMLPTFMIGEELKSGRLQQVLSDYDVPASMAYAVYLPNRYLSPKVRAFIDFFIHRFQPEPYWDA